MIALGIAAFLWVAVFLFVWTLCVAAGNADALSEKEMNELRMRRRQETEARSKLYGGTGGFRG